MAKITACLITFPSPDNHTGPDEQEIYLNAREGLLRVLDLLTDNVEDAHLLMNNDGLEAAIAEAEQHSDGLVHWTFVPVMDLNIVP
jgi:hypothetical protein